MSIISKVLKVSKCAVIALIVIAFLKNTNLLSQIKKTFQPNQGGGVIVIFIDKGSLAQSAGVQTGDTIVGWSQNEQQGKIDSPVDLANVEHELCPRGKISLIASRQGAIVRFDFSSVPWGFQTTPNSVGIKALLARMSPLLAKHEVSQIEELCRSACPQLNLSDQPWGFLITAQVISLSGEWRKAADFLTAALAATGGANSNQRALLYEDWGDMWRWRGDWSGARDYYSAALKQYRTDRTHSLAAALDLYNIAMADFRLGDIPAAENLATQALHIRRKLSPSSLEVVKVLNYLGVFCLQDGDLDSAEDYLKQALALADRVHSNGKEMAFALNNLGAVADRRGDLAIAEQYYSRDLDISTQLNPDDYLLTYSLENLGTIAFQRGNFSRAIDYYSRAMQIQETRGSGRDIAMSLNNMAVVSAAERDLPNAEKLLRQALVIQDKVDPHGVEIGQTLDTLGTVLRKQRRLDDAAETLEKALAFRNGISPNSLEVAETIEHLGEVDLDQSNLDEAQRNFSSAAQIRETLAPTSSAYADSLIALAQLARTEGRLELSSGYFEKALDVLDNQEARIGGAMESRREFNFRYSSYYAQYVAVLMELGNTRQALEVLERSKARTLLSALRTRDIHITAGIPSALFKRQHRTETLITRATDERISALTAQQPAANIRHLDQQIAQLRAERERITSEMYAENPRYVSLFKPRPLSATEIQHLLDPDTLLLDYFIDQEKSYVFAITSARIESFSLASGAIISKLAQKFYGLNSSPPEKRPQANDNGEDLSKAILGKISDELPKYQRIVIAADKSLTYVPFASLPTPSASPLEPYLISKHEIVMVPSATFLAIGRRLGPGTRRRQLNQVAIVADPVFDSEDPRVRPTTALAAANHGRAIPTEFKLPRLIYSRSEADAIVRAIRPVRSEEVLDFSANREKATSPEILHSRIAHFATHGFYDAPTMGLTGLLFSNLDVNGNYRAGFWSLNDIFNASVTADLVVLSACRTGIGEDWQSDETIGLSQAFLFAGARDVAASLWDVDDASTAALMSRFYDELEHHAATPVRALQQAQLFLMRSKRWKDPYYWAGFTVEGDWHRDPR